MVNFTFAFTWSTAECIVYMLVLALKRLSESPMVLFRTGPSELFSVAVVRLWFICCVLCLKVQSWVRSAHAYHVHGDLADLVAGELSFCFFFDDSQVYIYLLTYM